MRRFFPILSVLAIAALIAPSSATAAKQPKPAAWAAKYHLTGAWRAKDADRDGLKNLEEFKRGTHPRKVDSDRDGLKDGDEVTSGNDPRKPDSDGDGVKDGAEHAGVVTAFDGETATIRQFNGPKRTAILDCTGDVTAQDAAVADEENLDDGYVEVTDEEWVEDDAATEEETVTDLGESTAAPGCELAPGDVLRSAELEQADGALYLVAFDLV